MKKNVLVFGLISGVIITAMMVIASMMLYNNSGEFEGNMVLGFAIMLAAFSFIFVGIRNFRNNYNNGFISFGKAFQTGFLIAFIASTIYVGVWLVEYYVFIPDFIEKYAQHVIITTQKSGATAAELAVKKSEMEWHREMYKNSLMIILITYSEVLPLGVLVALISALILKKKPTSTINQI